MPNCRFYDSVIMGDEIEQCQMNIFQCSFKSSNALFLVTILNLKDK